MEIFFFWVILAVGVGVLANSRGRSGFGFFLLAVLLSPLIGLIVVLVTENLTRKAEHEQQAERDHARRLAEVKVLAAAPAAAATAASRGGVSVADELTKLVALRDKGVLTEDEFAAQKASLLGTSSAAPAAAPKDPLRSWGEPTIPAVASVQLGACTHCEAIIPVDTLDCPKCKASFGSGSAWRVRPL